MSKHRKRPQPAATFTISDTVTGNPMPFSIRRALDATDYSIYGIAPIPVRIGADESVRIEPTPDGYNVYEVS